MPDDPRDPISPPPNPWALFRANHQRPPVRRLGWLTLAGAVVFLPVGVGLWLADQPGDNRLGPYGGLLPLFFLLTGLSCLFSGLSDLQDPRESATILRLRLVSTAFRIATFATWTITLVGLLTE